MKTLVDQLTKYATYHRDRRNIATHLIGIPMIVVAIAILLSRPGVTAGGMLLTPALALTGATVLYYLMLDVRFGLVMSILLVLVLWAGNVLAAQSTGIWLGAGLGLFVVGWIFQLLGHVYEGKKPAFVDDLTGLIIGPLFVVAEVGFAMGMRVEIEEQIEQRAGPIRSVKPQTT
ncbi:MAG: Mpo1-like protein [Rhodoferax sp.]